MSQTISAPAPTPSGPGRSAPDLDALLASSDLDLLPPDDVADLRLRFLRDAVRWHVERNPRYAEYCRAAGFTVDQIRTVADLGRVPMLPAGLFKRGAETVATEPADQDVLGTTSSGTQGTISVVPRDDLTLNRFFATVGIGTFQVLGQERSDLRVFNIGPLEAGNLWIAYVMSGVALFSDGQCYVEDDTFRLGTFLSDLEAGAHEPVLIVGPPALILDAAHAAAEKGIRLHRNSMIVTIGGWKRATGSMVPRPDFIERVTEAFGLDEAARIRDTFNMVELNTVLFECAEHRLHAPPWLYLDVRNPSTLEPLPSGETGVLGFLDPTPTSYPGFVLSDDFATVDRDHECRCGRTGDVLTVDRRINSVEGRGCALKLDERTSR